jgi:single-strand DNA-binding protein
MATFNKVILLGNLTRDPELRTTPNGTSICRFSLAVSRQFRNGDGSMREEVAFVEVDSFGKQAETIARHMAKGRPLLVEGRLRLDQWDSQNGDKRSRLMVVAENFQFIGAPRPGGDGQQPGEGEGQNGRYAGPQRQAGGNRRQPREEIDGGSGGDEGEIPF